MKKQHTINITQYINEKQDDLLDIIEKERRIMLVANPGTGKTRFSSELMEMQKKKETDSFMLLSLQQFHNSYKLNLIST